MVSARNGWVGGFLLGALVNAAFMFALWSGSDGGSSNILGRTITEQASLVLGVSRTLNESEEAYAEEEEEVRETHVGDSKSNAGQQNSQHLFRTHFVDSF